MYVTDVCMYVMYVCMWTNANIPPLTINHYLKNFFFLSTITEWNNLDPNLQNSDTYKTFKNTILKFLKPSPDSVIKCHNPQGIKFLTRFKLSLSHCREHKFKHGFQDLLNPLCKCGFDGIQTSCSTAPFTKMVDPPS